MEESTAWVLIIFTICASLAIPGSLSVIYGKATDERSAFIDRCTGGYQSERFRCAELALRYKIGGAASATDTP